jgi:2-oxoglutarate ferredoxin oxidoreductase subunit gamma
MTAGATDKTEIRLGGVGGQGIALAGTLLCKAAALFDDKEAVFTQTHGPEARGGASRADVIIGTTSVAYPFVTNPQVLVVLFQEAYEKFRPQLDDGGLLIVEEDLVNLHPDDEGAIRLPAVRIAKELGNKLAANIIMLGYLIKKTGVVSREAMEQAIRNTVREQHVELNIQALEIGWNLASEAAND